MTPYDTAYGYTDMHPSAAREAFARPHDGDRADDESDAATRGRRAPLPLLARRRFPEGSDSEGPPGRAAARQLAVSGSLRVADGHDWPRRVADLCFVAWKLELPHDPLNAAVLALGLLEVSAMMSVLLAISTLGFHLLLVSRYRSPLSCFLVSDCCSLPRRPPCGHQACVPTCSLAPHPQCETVR